MKHTITFINGGTTVSSSEMQIVSDRFTVSTTLEEYPDFAATYEQHTIHNPSDAPSALIENFVDADILLPLAPAEMLSPLECTSGSSLRVNRMLGTVPTDVYNRDDLRSANEFGLVTDWLTRRRVYQNVGGRSSDGTMPLFDISNGTDGYIIFLGWTGSWYAEFRPAEGGVQAVLRLKNNSFSLPAGEKLSTLSTLIMEYHNGAKAARNQFRRLLKKHFSTVGQPGRPEQAMTSFELWGALPSDKMCERIDTLKEKGIVFDYIWLDAGWNGTTTEDCPGPGHGAWNDELGDWQINSYYHPDGLQDVVQHTLDAGMQLELWVEPERNTISTPVVQAHPDWYTIGDKNHALIDYGHPDAWQFAYDTLCHLIDTLKLGCYRQDFNTYPDRFWNKDRTPEEAALKEMQHINGMYRLWDALLERYPHLIIDNCSSGGRRFDLETTKRSIAFFRSDYQCRFWPDPDVTQCHNALSEYIPYNGCTTKVKNDTYAARSTYAAAWGGAFWNMEFQTMNEEELAWAAAITQEYKRLQPYFSCDYYSLGAQGYDKTAWVIWQYDRPEENDGLILAFRRAESRQAVMQLAPEAIKPDHRYTFTDVDTGEEWCVTAEQLPEMLLTIPEKRMSRVLLYHVEPMPQ